MKTGSKKSTITIITLACLLAVAVASTVILAAFSAVRTSTTTITFAEGLTMQLAPKTNGETANIKITTPDTATNYGTFSYGVGVLNENSFNGYENTVTLDGITATLNKDGYVAYQITLSENSNPIAGAWAQVLDTENGNAPTNSVVFTPADPSQNAKNAWKATLTVDASKVTVNASNNVVTVTFNNQWTSTGSTLTQDLFTLIVIDGVPAGNVNDLAGRSIVADFTIKADTASAPTFA